MKRKVIRLFLIGMLCGVMTAAAFTYAFALPANSNYWRMEIYKRGGAAWTMDKNGHIGWQWMIQPKSDAPRSKGVTVPPSDASFQTERL